MCQIGTGIPHNRFCCTYMNSGSHLLLWLTNWNPAKAPKINIASTHRLNMKCKRFYFWIQFLWNPNFLTGLFSVICDTWIISNCIFNPFGISTISIDISKSNVIFICFINPIFGLCIRLCIIICQIKYKRFHSGGVFIILHGKCNIRIFSGSTINSVICIIRPINVQGIIR